ncbi:MAG: serine O-acetyltransferase [Candidatus Spyradosoma sp.]
MDAKRYGYSPFKAYLLSPGFKYTFWMRLTKYLRKKNYFLHICAKVHLRSLGYKFGMDIPWILDVGPGFYIGHFGGIVINGGVKIGKNVNISHGVTIGIHSRGGGKGVPQIKDCVYIGPGAKIFGNVSVESRAAIGANAVVTKDIPPYGVAVGIPAKVISFKGSAGYVNINDPI